MKDRAQLARPVFRSAVGLAVAGALVLTACGNDDGPDTADAPPVFPADTQPEQAEMAEPAGDIVEVASTTDGFSTLVAALQAADLVETLQGDGPFTVFAPTDEAFAALPEGVIDSLLLPENQGTLQRILTYHVVAGEVRSGDIEPGEVETVEGSAVKLSVDDGVMVDGANVLAADVEASNGVIHVIDAVILPADIAAAL